MTLDVVAVESFTQGRLDRDDAETTRQLEAALAAARTYCGWHVTPVLANQSVTVDGPGGTLLMLPTLALTSLIAVTEDSVVLDMTGLEWSTRGIVRKLDGRLWTGRLRGITATISHGIASAPDFEAVVLAAIDRGALASGSDTLARVIGPFQYDSTASEPGAIFTNAERAVLDRYALERVA